MDFSTDQPSTEGYCPRIFDSWSCFNETPPDSGLVISRGSGSYLEYSDNLSSQCNLRLARSSQRWNLQQKDLHLRKIASFNEMSNVTFCQKYVASLNTKLARSPSWKTLRVKEIFNILKFATKNITFNENLPFSNVTLCMN